MGKILDRILSIVRRRSTEKIIPKESGITRPDSVERTSFISRQGGIFQAETGAPLQPEHRERFEKIFGPAVIRNGYKHTVTLQNDLLNIVLQPGESRVVSEVSRAQFSNKGHGPHNMLQEWDPYNTLRDVVAEYERGQEPISRYNMSTESLCATSKINVWRQRGQETIPGAPHRPSTDLRWKDQDETPTGNPLLDDPSR